MAGIPVDTDLNSLGVIKSGNLPPLISTAAVNGRDGTRAGDGGGQTDPPYDPVGILFEDSFDDQPDWDSGLPENTTGLTMPPGDPGWWPVAVVQHAGTHRIPLGWSHVRQTPRFAPSRGHPNKHENIEVNAATVAENPNRARGGAGKSAVFWRDADDNASFSSDGILLKHLDEGAPEIYVEFYINFSDGFIDSYYNAPGDGSHTTGQAKLFRVYNWTGVGAPFQYHGELYDENKKPLFIWDGLGYPETRNGYGFRNQLAFMTKRSSPVQPGEEKYLNAQGDPSNDFPSSYHPITTTSNGGDTLIDRLTGQPMDPEQFSIDIDQVFGDETHWTRMGFYLKMNSAPGAFDGVYTQWVDGRKVLDLKTMQWVSAGQTMNGGRWNAVALGGNDFFQGYPRSDKHEDWYAIDDLVILDSIPQELL